MRAQKWSLLIIIDWWKGSFTFRWVVSFNKVCVEGLTDCLRIEVKQFGIKVVLIEPGLISTKFTNHL